MARKGSSRKAVYVTHKKQSPLQRAINRRTGVREAAGTSERNARRRGLRKAFGLATG